MNTSTMLTAIVILILLYPFALYFQLKGFETKLDTQWEKIKKLLEKEKTSTSEELVESIHIERRAYNATVRANNNKLSSTLAQFMAKKYGFKKRELFEFQGR